MGTQQASCHFHLFTLPSAIPGWPTGSPRSVPFEGRLSLTSPYKSSHSQGVQAISFASFCIPNAHLSALPTHDGNLATVVVPHMQQRNRQTQLTLPQSHHQDYSLPSPSKTFQKFSHLREAGRCPRWRWGPLLLHCGMPSGFQGREYLEWGWVKNDGEKEDLGSSAFCSLSPKCRSVLSRFSRVRLCNPMDCSLPGSSVHGILQQEYWSGLPFPPPGDLPDPGIEPESLKSPEVGAKYPLERAG